MFNYIFFTGSVRVGKIVMEAASKNLIPVTLELGGKSPCIVDKDANIKLSAKRIVWGKYLNVGQTCVAPDYVYVHKDVKEKLLKEMVKEIESEYGKDAKTVCALSSTTTIPTTIAVAKRDATTIGDRASKTKARFLPTTRAS